MKREFAPAQLECLRDQSTEVAVLSFYDMLYVIEVNASECAAVEEELLKVDARALFAELPGGDNVRRLVHNGSKRGDGG